MRLRIKQILPTLAMLLAMLLTGGISSSECAEPGEHAHSPSRNPLVRVVTLSQDGLQDAAGKPMVAGMLTRLDRAASFKPDIVCLPEVFTRDAAETAPGPTTNRLSAWAKQHACYVICPIKVQAGDRQYNSAVLLDRQGEIVGRYDKVRPTEGELASSISPGPVDPPVFETDFGKIGIQICFDVNWHAQWRRLKEQGAQIVFFPSAFPADRQLRSHAWLHQYFIVSSTRTRSATIYDITGDPLATTGKYQRWTGAVLPIGKRLFEIDFHIKKMREITAKYGQKVQVTWYHDDDLVSLASVDPELTVDDLIEEFQLTPHVEYIRRAQQAQDELRPVEAANANQ